MLGTAISKFTFASLYERNYISLPRKLFQPQRNAWILAIAMFINSSGSASTSFMEFVSE
jgi:hypothetical protein